MRYAALKLEDRTFKEDQSKKTSRDVSAKVNRSSESSDVRLIVVVTSHMHNRSCKSRSRVKSSIRRDIVKSMDRERLRKTGVGLSRSFLMILMSRDENDEKF